VIRRLRRVFTKLIHRWHSLLSRQADDLVSPRVNEGIGANDKGADPLLANGLESYIDVIVTAHLQDVNLQTNGMRRIFDLSDLSRRLRIIGIDDKAYDCGLGHYLMALAGGLMSYGIDLIDGD
jgi:hypothetical protein